MKTPPPVSQPWLKQIGIAGNASLPKQCLGARYTFDGVTLAFPEIRIKPLFNPRRYKHRYELDRGQDNGAGRPILKPSCKACSPISRPLRFCCHLARRATLPLVAIVVRQILIRAKSS